MASLKEEASSPASVILPGLEDISLLDFCKPRSESVTRSLWEDEVGACQNFFDGGTDEADEDKALKTVMKSETYAELAFIVNKLSWDVLDDELDEADLTEIAKRLSALRNRVEHQIEGVLRGLALKPETFASSQSADVDQAIGQHVTWLGGIGRETLAENLLAQRAQLLNSIALFALRGRPTSSREFRVLVDDLAGRVPSLANDLTALSWDAFYDNRVCIQLEQARYRLLLQTLPDMVDPSLPLLRRRALFDTLVRRDGEFRAMQDFVANMGTVAQRTDVDAFMDARQLFLDTFTNNAPNAGLIQQIAAFFNSVADQIAELRAAVATTAQGMIDSLTLGHILGTDADDTSRKTVGVLNSAGRLALLPTQWKVAMVHLMEEGNCDDDDEQAINQIFSASKSRSLADFAQLIAAQGWESLSFSFDGQEYEDLEKMCSSW